jgi:hypothetical protein
VSFASTNPLLGGGVVLACELPVDQADIDISAAIAFCLPGQDDVASKARAACSTPRLADAR